MEEGILPLIDAADLEREPPIDLLDEMTQREILARARSGYWQGVHTSPPCATWSRVLYLALAEGWGPRPYRSREALYGLPDLEPARARRCRDGTAMLLFALQVEAAVVRAGGSATREHPADPGEPPYPSSWILPETLDFNRAVGAVTFEFDQCEFGAPSRKSTGISWASARSRPRAWVLGVFAGGRPLVCSHRQHPKALRGRGPDGAFRTTAAAAYPPEMTAALARLHLTYAAEEDLAVRLSASDLQAERHAAPLAVEQAGERVAAPPLGSRWTRPGLAWHTVFTVQWARVEPSNVVELRMAVLAVQHLCRSQTVWGCKVLLAVDNLCALAVLGKGRSSSPALRHASRKVAAYVLSAGVAIFARWVPSKRNLADGPSRGRPIDWGAVAAQTELEEQAAAQAVDDSDGEDLDGLELEDWLRRFDTTVLPAASGRRGYHG